MSVYLQDWRSGNVLAMFTVSVLTRISPEKILTRQALFMNFYVYNPDIIPKIYGE